jgi:hypothetical protein
VGTAQKKVSAQIISLSAQVSKRTPHNFKNYSPMSLYNRLLIGSNIQAVLLASANNAHESKDHLLDIVCEIYDARQLVVKPYPLPFCQAHCACCRWSYPVSSAHAILHPCSTRFEAYFKVSDSYDPPLYAASEVTTVFLSGQPTRPLGSRVFTVQPGQTSLWCGLKAIYDSRVLQYMLFLAPQSDGHTDYIQCKPPLAIVGVYRT